MLIALVEDIRLKGIRYFVTLIPFKLFQSRIELFLIIICLKTLYLNEQQIIIKQIIQKSCV